MLSRISQFKQTLADEFEQASQAKPGTDPIAVIQRNKAILEEETPNVDQIIDDLGSTNESNDDSKDQNANESKMNDDNKNNKAENMNEATSETKKDAGSQGTTTTSDSNTSVSPATKDVEKKPETEASKSNIDNSTSKPEISSAETPKAETPKAETPKAETPKPETPKAETPTKKQDSQNDPNLATKLAKLAKFEEKYPLLLKAYKTEKKRSELVKLYESVLSEHTPCTSISQPQELVDFLNGLSTKTDMLQKELASGKVEFDKTQKSLDASKRSAEQSANEAAQLKRQLSKLTQEHNDLKNELNNLKQHQNDQQATAKADSELKNKIEILQSQLNLAEQSRDAAQKSQSNLKSQLEEITVRFNELQSEGDVIRDELGEAERISQQRLNELNALKDSLRHRERDRRQNADTINDQVNTLSREKEQLEGEVEQLNKRIIRESEHLNTQIRSLRVQLTDSEEHERKLRKQLTQAQSRTDSQIHDANKHTFAPQPTNISNEHSSLEAEEKSNSANEAALSEARASATSAAKANELLKAVNADNVLRIEKLQKTQRALAADLEQVRHENAVLKRRRSSVTSVGPAGAVPTENTAENEKQQAYLKNVLLGFAEHKDQRKALLPVLATLLGLSDSEANKFVTNL